MAISNPRSDILTSRYFVQQSFDLMMRQEISRTAGGVTIGKDLGPALWTAEWRTRPQSFEDAVEYEAMLRSLNGVIGRFHGYDLRRRYPAHYPTGDFADSGKIHSVTSPNAIRIKNLPANFVISVGDYFSFSYGSNPSNVALHQAVESVVANGSGLTAAFEVRPHIRDGAVEDTDVIFKRPYAEFSLSVEGFNSEMIGMKFNAATIRGVQRIR